MEDEEEQLRLPPSPEVWEATKTRIASLESENVQLRAEVEQLKAELEKRKGDVLFLQRCIQKAVIAYHGAFREGCDANGAWDCAVEELSASPIEPPEPAPDKG